MVCSFNEHTNNKTNEATRGIGLLCKLQPILPHRSLLIIYECFIRPHLDCGDAIYDQLYNVSFSNNVALAITGAIKGSSCDMLYHKLGLQYFQQRRWIR